MRVLVDSLPKNKVENILLKIDAGLLRLATFRVSPHLASSPLGILKLFFGKD